MQENDIKNLEITQIKKTNALIVKDNRLVNSKHSYTLLQARFMAYICSAIRKQDVSFFSYQTTINSFCTATGINIKNIKRDAGEIRLLMQKIITLQDDKEALELVTLLSYFKIDYKNNLVTYRFDEAMKPLLLDLKSKLTKTSFLTTMTFRSAYTIRFYDIIQTRISQFNKYKNSKIINYEVDLQKLKELLVGNYSLKKDKIIIPTSYNTFADFRVKVLDVAQKELELKNDYYFKYEAIKTGRKVTAIKFQILRSEKKIKADLKDKRTNLFAQDKSMFKLRDEQIKRIMERKQDTIKNHLKYEQKLCGMWDKNTLKLDKDLKEIYDEYKLTLSNKKAELAYNHKHNIND